MVHTEYEAAIPKVMLKYVYVLSGVGLSCASCSAPNPIPAPPSRLTQVAQLPTPAPTPAPTATSFPTSTRKPPDPVVLQQLQRLRGADPAQDLEEAWKQGDRRFIGVNGVAGSEVLGIKNPMDPLILRNGVNMIPGTADFITSHEQDELQELATRYAIRYNRLLMSRLQTATS